MRSVLFDPFTIQLPGEDRVVVANTNEAADILSHRWPGRKGELYKLAISVSMEHMLRRRLPQEVRAAFLAAAEEAGILVSYDVAGQETGKGRYIDMDVPVHR